MANKSRHANCPIELKKQFWFFSFSPSLRVPCLQKTTKAKTMLLWYAIDEKLLLSNTAFAHVSNLSCWCDYAFVKAVKVQKET